jgi:hypothetical protein
MQRKRTRWLVVTAFRFVRRPIEGYKSRSCLTTEHEKWSLVIKFKGRVMKGNVCRYGRRCAGWQAASRGNEAPVRSPCTTWTAGYATVNAPSRADVRSDRATARCLVGCQFRPADRAVVILGFDLERGTPIQQDCAPGGLA